MNLQASVTKIWIRTVAVLRILVRDGAIVCKVWKRRAAMIGNLICDILEWTAAVDYALVELKPRSERC